MRETKTAGWVLHPSARMLMRGLRLTAVCAGIGLVLASGVARAEDPEEDDSTFEEKIIKKIMTGLGGTNMENGGITYRERSPLVVPPNLDLPPPEAGKRAANVPPNWPVDPSIAERKRQRELAKTKVTGLESSRPLMPSELAAGRIKPGPTPTESLQPGNSLNNPVLSPSQLGYKGGLFSTMFGGNKAETAPFPGEPTRESLVQPPVGYQTPSPDYAYGTGPKESLNNKHTDIMTGKEVSN
ncbi:MULTISPECIES: hypothetical protein [Rhodopseudomonas]|uniref:Signal peptide protein n=1 Tax=Rhodopseudomonas palustris TaxID=1076 RepID=A0A0D7E8X5_RHOPL|nr:MULTISPECIES: hypothetical protein [Rhodopseudomonas]KIZ37208.1 signal peptide protein [Rhodopseudomonas palustris]MDF3811536.1 hypothetical protein [Rhodopseudomonas sp. BAL398]WOK15576.1 hypothetical protein RBJ75_15425 [Rhodopseudomonas sp. BAL398]